METTNTRAAKPISALGASAAFWARIYIATEGASALMSIAFWLEPTKNWTANGVAIVVIVNLCLFIGSGAVSLKWLYRASLNAHAIGKGLRNSPAWSVGWFFVPIAWLWKPFQAVEDVWQVSHQPSGWKNRPTPSLLRVWWGFWLLAMVSGNMAFRLGINQQIPDAAAGAAMVDVVSSISYLVAGLCFLSIIETITTKQSQRLAASV